MVLEKLTFQIPEIFQTLIGKMTGNHPLHSFTVLDNCRQLFSGLIDVGLKVKQCLGKIWANTIKSRIQCFFFFSGSDSLKEISELGAGFKSK